MTTLARRLKGADSMNTTLEALTRESRSLRCGAHVNRLRQVRANNNWREKTFYLWKKPLSKTAKRLNENRIF